MFSLSHTVTLAVAARAGRLDSTACAASIALLAWPKAVVSGDEPGAGESVFMARSRPPELNRAIHSLTPPPFGMSNVASAKVTELSPPSAQSVDAGVGRYVLAGVGKQSITGERSRHVGFRRMGVPESTGWSSESVSHGLIMQSHSPSPESSVSAATGGRYCEVESVERAPLHRDAVDLHASYSEHLDGDVLASGTSPTVRNPRPVHRRPRYPAASFPNRIRVASSHANDVSCSMPNRPSVAGQLLPKFGPAFQLGECLACWRRGRSSRVSMHLVSSYPNVLQPIRRLPRTVVTSTMFETETNKKLAPHKVVRRS
jgi:hypothetical protein